MPPPPPIVTVPPSPLPLPLPLGTEPTFFVACYLNLALALALAASTEEYAEASDDDGVPAEERVDQRNRPRIARRTADPDEKSTERRARETPSSMNASPPSLLCRPSPSPDTSTWTSPRLRTSTRLRRSASSSGPC